MPRRAEKCTSSLSSCCHVREHEAHSRTAAVSKFTLARAARGCLNGTLRIVHDLYVPRRFRRCLVNQRRNRNVVNAGRRKVRDADGSIFHNSPSGFAVNRNLRMNRLNVISALCSSTVVRASRSHRAKFHQRSETVEVTRSSQPRISLLHRVFARTAVAQNNRW